MRALQYGRLGEAEDVLSLNEVGEPHPSSHQISVRVAVCAINPADLALCRGLFPGELPRGIGLEVAGTVDEVGSGVSGVAVGDPVLGPAPYAGPTGGAADLAVLDEWTPVPDGLDLPLAASLPMAAATATSSLDGLGVGAGQVLLVHGAGSMMGFVAVQLARHRGARVIATAGASRKADLETLGVAVTAYGEGMVERVRTLADGPVDRALDASPGTTADPLTDLVAITGDPDRVLTMSHFESTEALGVRTNIGQEATRGLLADVAALAARGELAVPVARTFVLEQWREAIALSASNQAGGKLLLLLL
jgi:NADPH:quinone reductase-like Zn-dependent oxidoreductase